MARARKPIDDQLEADPRFGAILLAWDVPEYRKYERGPIWYLAMALLGLVLLIYSVASANFLFALFLVMFSLMVYLTSVSDPRVLRFAVTETGVLLDGTHRPFRDINRFWMIYEPPVVKSLYIEFKSALQPRMVIDLDDMNPNEVRELLGQFAPEDLDEDTEPLSDYLGRMLKI